MEVHGYIPECDIHSGGTPVPTRALSKPPEVIPGYPRVHVIRC